MSDRIVTTLKALMLRQLKRSAAYVADHGGAPTVLTCWAAEGDAFGLVLSDNDIHNWERVYAPLRIWFCLKKVVGYTVSHNMWEIDANIKLPPDFDVELVEDKVEIVAINGVIRGNSFAVKSVITTDEDGIRRYGEPVWLDNDDEMSGGLVELLPPEGFDVDEVPPSIRDQVIKAFEGQTFSNRDI